MLWTPDPFNRRTGKLLGYNYYLKFSGYDPEKGGDYFRGAMKQPGKKMLTEEGQAFANWIKKLGEEVDPLTPWLIKQFKDGHMGVVEGDDSGHLFWWRFVGNGGTGLTTLDLERAAEILRKYAAWYNATDSPHRQGKNIQEMSLEEVNDATRQHLAWVQEQEQERQRKEEVQRIFQNVNQATVFEWPDGWTVKELSSAQDLVNEGEAMKHCIGQDNQPYCRALEEGAITAYSLRDPEGMPHATWHYNEDGTLAQVQGFQGHDPKEEYQERFEEWANSEGRSVDPVGDMDYENWDDEWTLKINSVFSFEAVLGSEENLWDIALEDGADFDPNGYGQESVYIDIDWKSLVQDIVDKAPAKIENRQESWRNEWATDSTAIPVNERRPDGPQLKLFKEYGDGKPLEDIEWYSYPADWEGKGLPRVLDTIYHLEEDKARDTGWDKPELLKELDRAIREFAPEEWTEVTKEAYGQVVEQWNQVREDFSDPTTFGTNFEMNRDDPTAWPDFDDVSYYGPEDELPSAEWKNDPSNVPPLWVEETLPLGGEARPTAVPWWATEVPGSRFNPYSEDTSDENLMDSRRKVWNWDKAAARRFSENKWIEDPIDTDQKMLPGMCPNCGSAAYEVGWEFPTQTVRNKWDLETVDEEHPFSSGWYFYCPDCGYYEGYTGAAAEARERQLPQLEKQDRWDRRKERFRRLSPTREEDPLLYSIDKEQYDYAKERWQNDPPSWMNEPKEEDYVRPIQRGRGAPSADLTRTDPFYQWASNLVADAFESEPNAQIKEPNFKSLLKRMNKDGIVSLDHPEDYTSKTLINFAKRTNQLPELRQAAEEVASEFGLVTSAAPNHLGSSPNQCKCPTCNRQRGQRARWKEKYAIKAIRESWKSMLGHPWDRERLVERYPEFENMTDREILRQDPSQEDIDYALERGHVRGGYITLNRYLNVVHDRNDWRQQWFDYFVSVGLAKPITDDINNYDNAKRLIAAFNKAGDKFEALKALKSRAERITKSIDELEKDPSTPSDPS